MALNLDSLKNLSTSPVDTPEKTHTLWIAHASQEVTAHNSAPETVTMSPSSHSVEETSSMRPRLSLMKLKKASSGDVSDVVPEAIVDNSLSDNLSVAELEKWFTSQVKTEEDVIISEKIEESEILPIPEISPISAQVEEIPSTPKEDSIGSQSIVIGGEEWEALDAEQVPVEPKELFPNFRISSTVQLDDDLLDFQDVITSNTFEAPAEALPKQSVALDVEVPLTIQEESVSQDEEKATIQEVVSEDVVNTETIEPTETVSITPEYVAEIKTELSEGRRAGFRFLMQKKTKIIAGMTVVFSLSLIAIISGSLFSNDVHKTGKSNVQEVQNVVPAIVSTTGSQVAPGVEPAGYEMGRDYSVTKNTKKNVRSKPLDNTLSGSGTPTP